MMFKTRCKLKVAALHNAVFKHNYKLYLIGTHRFCSQSKDPKENKENDEKKEDDGSIFSLFKSAWSWSNKVAEEMQQNAHQSPDDQTDEANPDDSQKWSSMLSEIRERNKFDLDIDPHSFQEYTSYHQISQTEFMHRTMMKINYYPLKFDEFMVGSHQGFEFILNGLEQNDTDGFDGVIVPEIMEKIDELKDRMFDEKYESVGNVMSFLKDVRNGPNYKDASINAVYTVRYYYQLKCSAGEDEGDADNDKGKEKGTEEYIQKRCDVKWQANWFPAAGGWMGTFKISEDGWQIQDIECVDVPKMKKS